MKKYVRSLLRIVPILTVGVILTVSSFIFNLNKRQTCERIRNLKESQIQIIANQIDLGTGMDPDYFQDEVNVKILRKAIESINEQTGVYCYLFDKECNLISSFSKSQKHVTGEAIIKSLVDNNIEVLVTEEYQGYISTNTGNNEYLIHWRGLPSGNRDTCEYFIVLAVAENEVQENEAIGSCKVMIGILSILLCLSMYANLYVNPVFSCVEETKEKKNN